MTIKLKKNGILDNTEILDRIKLFIKLRKEKSLIKRSFFYIITTHKPKLEAIIERCSTNIDAVECFCSALVVRNLQRHIAEVLMPAVLLRTNTFKNFEHMWRTNFYCLGSRGREGNIFIPLYQFRSLANIQIIFCCFRSDLVHVITTMLLDNIYPPLQTNIWFYFHCILFEILCQILLQ